MSMTAPDTIDPATLEGDAGIPSDAALSNVARLVREQMRLEDEIAEMEDALSRAKAELHAVRTDRLPAAMAEAGVSSFTTHDGASVKVQPFVSASLSQENPDRDRAIAWLHKHGHGAIVKHVVGVRFTKGEDEKAQAVKAALREAGYEPEDIESVHNRTLVAFLREQVEAGENVPLDLFRAFVGQTTKIVRPEGRE